MRYWSNPAERAATSARTSKNKQERYARDPAYKRAFYAWNEAKRRTRIPPWVSITDFLPVARTAVRKGPQYEFDHVIPLRGELVCGLHVPSNLRVVLKTTNQKKRNKFVIA